MNINKLLHWGLILISFCSFFYLSLLTSNANYYFIGLLPLVYSLCMLYCNNCNHLIGKNIVFTIVVFGFFVRNVILPILMFNSDFLIWFGLYETVLPPSNVASVMNSVIFIMSIEQIFAFIYLKKTLKNIEIEYLSMDVYGKRHYNNHLLYSFIIISLLIIVVGSMYLYPSSANYIKFIWSIGDAINEDATSFGMPRILYRLFLLSVDLLQLLIPMTLLTIIIKSRYTNTFKTVLTAALTLAVLCITSDNNVKSILLSLVITICFKRYYEKYKVFKFFLIGISVVAVVALIQKTFGDGMFGTYKLAVLTGIFNSYFNGPYNVGAGLLLADDYNISFALSDIVNSIPFFPLITGDIVTTPKLYNWLIKGSDTQVTKVIPLVAQSSLYFSVLFSPLLTILSLKLASFFENASFKINNLHISFLCVYLALYSAITPMVYNLNILIKSVLNAVIVILILKLCSIRIK